MGNVTILILVDGFLQYKEYGFYEPIKTVTILILVDGFLQYLYRGSKFKTFKCHNPYFSRWFSAI